MSKPVLKPDSRGQCPRGYIWSSIYQGCIPLESAPAQVGVKPDARGQCPPGYIYSGASKTCVPLKEPEPIGIKPDAQGQCPKGYIYSGVSKTCVPIGPAPTNPPVTDIGHKIEKPPIQPDANGKCPKGYEFSALMGQCVPIGTAQSPLDFTVTMSLKRKPTETQFEALRSVTILGLVLDRRFQQLGMESCYEAVFTKKTRTTEGRTVAIIPEFNKELLEHAAGVARELSIKFPQHASATEWKHRAAMFQHVSVKHLQDIREDQQAEIEGLKHTENLSEIARAYHYLKENLPQKTLHNADEASKHWLDAMLTLKRGGFSYYASQEAADHIAFTIDKTDRAGRYHFREQYINLPSTWEDVTVMAWRQAEEDSTREKQELDAEHDRDEKERASLKPLLTALIKQGMTNEQIHATLKAQRKPRQLIRGLMLDVDLQRLEGIERRKPPQIQVTTKPAKREDNLTPDQLTRLLDMFDQDVTALFPTGLTDQEIYDRVTNRLGDFDKDGVEGPIYQIFMVNDSDLLKGRIRNLRKTSSDTQKPATTQPQKPEPEPWNKPRVYFKDGTPNNT